MDQVIPPSIAALVLELQPDAATCAYCAVAGYSWFVFDYGLNFADEIRYVWMSPWNISKLMYLWIRLFGIILLTVNIAVMLTGGHSADRYSCLGYYYWEGTAGSIMLYTVETVLQLRIYAMYNKNKWLAIFNGVLFVIEIIVMLVVYNVGIHAGTALATPDGLTGCYGLTVRYLFSIWIPGLAFEMWLVVLALNKAWQRSRAGAVVAGIKIDLLSLLIRDNVVYFILIALGLLANTLLWLAAPDGLIPAAVSLSHASMIISGTHLLLNLRIAYHARLNTGTTTNGATLDVSELTTFQARVPHGATTTTTTRRRRWGLDTSMLTEAEPYAEDYGANSVLVRMDMLKEGEEY